MTKTKMAVFTAKIKNIQEAIVVVAVPDGNKTWQHVVLSIDNNTFVVHQSTGTGILNKIPNILFPSCLKNSREEDTLTPANITLEQKIDEALAMTMDIEPIKLIDSDYSNSGSTLKVYIQKHFTVSQTVEDVNKITSKRKIAYPKTKIDYNLTWNSTILSNEEKESMRHPLDLDIAMSNDDRDCRKIVEKIMFTDYFTKNFTLIGLHGNPGGGKTKMILNDICALNNIPVVAIPCDPMMGVTQMLSQVGPVNQKTVLNEKEVVSLINNLKNRLTILQQNTQPTNTEIEEANSIVTALNNLATSSTQHAELVKTPSILMKCLKNNLPLVVFLDEANCSSTQFQNSLAPIISDGIFKDGPEVGHNNNTIKWILAWNPNTSNTKSFDGKFFDRISFVQVEDVTTEQRQSYRLRKTIHGLYDDKPDYSAADAIIAAAKAENTETKIDWDNILTDVHKYNASKAALEWLAKRKVNTALSLCTPNFQTGVFTNAYLADVTLDTQDKAAEAIKEIDSLVEKINDELYIQTKGKDIKNPDRNSFLYISDRNLDVFTDMIFSYSSVSKAVYRFLFDLIPAGNTLRTNSNTKSSEDQTPKIIAQAICDKLANEITKLHNILFVEICEAEVNQAQDALLKAQFDPAAWVVLDNNNNNSSVVIDDTNNISSYVDAIEAEANSMFD